MENAHLRKPAALWLAVTTLFGLAGTVVGLVPTVLAWALFRAGELPLWSAMGVMIPYASLMFCPLIAWWLLLKRSYALALIVATPPILMWALMIIWTRLF